MDTISFNMVDISHHISLTYHHGIHGSLVKNPWQFHGQIPKNPYFWCLNPYKSTFFHGQSPHFWWWATATPPSFLGPKRRPRVGGTSQLRIGPRSPGARWPWDALVLWRTGSGGGYHRFLGIYPLKMAIYMGFLWDFLWGFKWFKASKVGISRDLTIENWDL